MVTIHFNDERFISKGENYVVIFISWHDFLTPYFSAGHCECKAGLGVSRDGIASMWQPCLNSSTVRAASQGYHPPQCGQLHLKVVTRRCMPRARKRLPSSSLRGSQIPPSKLTMRCCRSTLKPAGSMETPGHLFLRWPRWIKVKSGSNQNNLI